MIRPVSDNAAHPTPEDWRILRALSFYRLLLVTLQLVLYESGYLAAIFEEFRPRWFYGGCVAYAIAALLLILPIIYRRPRVALQAHGHFVVDVAGILSLAYASGGVSSGLGMLILAPAVGCAMVISMRMALVQAAGATLALFAAEFLRQSGHGFDSGPFTQAGILGLMFFATSLAASAVALRARKSEALAESVGSDRDSLARLNESVIEYMQAGVAVIDADGRVRRLNDAAARLLGAEAGVALSEAAPGLATALHHWREGRPIGGAPVVPRPGAEELIPRFTRLGWGQAAPVLILLDSARALRDQAQQLKLAAIGRLSAGIAHEIRNPLSAISHAGQLLAETPGLSAESQQLLDMIQRHSRRIDKIVGDVLTLTRSRSASPSPIHLRPWLQQAVTQYLEAHPGQQRPIDFSEVSPQLYVRFDPSHLQQVLYNLWNNSFEHGARGGRAVTVKLSTGREGPGRPPQLDVHDNGPGIPRDLQEMVFEPFFTTAHSGTGLGLYLARELCEYNHARLSCRPVAEGACFRLVFSEALKEAA